VLGVGLVQGQGESVESVLAGLLGRVSIAYAGQARQRFRSGTAPAPQQHPVGEHNGLIGLVAQGLTLKPFLFHLFQQCDHSWVAGGIADALDFHHGSRWEHGFGPLFQGFDKTSVHSSILALYKSVKGLYDFITAYPTGLEEPGSYLYPTTLLFGGLRKTRSPPFLLTISYCSLM
jgi:hypothetical protein